MFKRSNLNIIVSFLFITIFISIILNVLFSSLEMNILSKGFYTEQAVKVKASHDIVPSLDNNLKKYFLFNIDTTKDIDIRSVNFKGDIKPPPMKEGRFFSKNDFNTTVLLAVIGINRKKDLSYFNNQAYYNIDGIEYKVIGILGAEYASPLDNSVFVNRLQNLSGIYIIDQHNSSFDNITEITGAIKIDERFSGFSRFFKVEFINITFYICSLITVLFMIVNIVFFWILKRQEKIGIKQMLGISNKYILKDIFIEYIIAVLSGIILGTIITIILNLFNIINLSKINVFTYLLIFMATFILSIILIIYPVIKILNCSVTDKMKGVIN